ncbi:MAG TPA: four helix bundle protein [Desulfatiglandales bacterium]|nr:four helix bundle protein [Desulfatiglandales bacterium]
MRDHTKLRAFELADEVVLLIYQATRKFPNEEIYRLTSQIRKANAKNLTAFSLQPKQPE